jgi:5-enolpyruvylshikimate-3-phosphate synthase
MVAEMLGAFGFLVSQHGHSFALEGFRTIQPEHSQVEADDAVAANWNPEPAAILDGSLVSIFELNNELKLP